MSVATKPRRRLMVRLIASIKKAGAVNTAANDHSDGAERRIAELSNRPTVAPRQIREMTPTKRFPNENVEETRRVHVEYLEDKKKEFTELLEKLKKEKDTLEGDEAEHVYVQWLAARRKEALTRDFDNILKEEREAMHAQVKKDPQEVEAERYGGAPNLQTRIERLDEAKRKVLLSLREVEDEELGNVDEGKQLRTKREELARRTKETEQKLASVEEVLRKVHQALLEQESAQSMRKEQLAAPPAERDDTTRKRTATQRCEESQSKKAKIPYGLEEEESEDEDEEHVHRREEPGREEKAAATNERDSAHKSVRILLNMNGPVQVEEVGREKEVNAREPPDAAAHATQQSSSSTSSATRRERQPPTSGTRILLDELEQDVANMEFQIDEGNKIHVACPYCGKEVSGWAQNICTHFVTHLRIEDRPYRCSQNGCYQTSIQVSGLRTHLRTHFEGRHKQLTWNDEMAQQCEVAPNKERLNAIKRLVEERTGRLKKLSFEELEEQARTSTLERDAFRCSICALTVKYNCGRSQVVGQHLPTHLVDECLPFACPAHGCKHATARLSRLKEHFQWAHKELEWTAEVEKKSVVTENVTRMEAIVRGVLAANHVERELSLDDLKARAANCTFTRDAKGILRMKCSVCTEQIKADKRSSIRYHLLSHLRHSSLPLRCSEDECPYMTSRLQNLRVHLRISHDGKELTEKMEKDCEINNNKKQLNAIVTSLCARRPRNHS